MARCSSRTNELRDIRGTFFHVRRMIDLTKTAKVNAYIMYIFGKIELLSIQATYNYFKMHYFNDFQEAKTTYIPDTGNLV